MAKAYDLKQVAEQLKVSLSTVKKLIKEDKLKAFKLGNKYIVNEISLLVFMGNKVEDCINHEQFEEHYLEMNELYDGKIDKEKFYEYYCSLFTPGPDLPSEYFIIEETPPPVEEKDYAKIEENQRSEEVVLTKADIINIIESLNKIQQILQKKIQ
jgi:excisionase family DNA binding protein